MLLEEARKEHRKVNYDHMAKKVSELEKRAVDNGAAIGAADSDVSKIAVEVDEKEALLKCDDGDAEATDDFESDPRPSNTCV